MRLNKFLAKAGVCSRRKAESLIEEGRVQVNGQRAEVTTPVQVDDVVTVDGELVHQIHEQDEEFLGTYLFHKPRGIICTLSDNERPNLKDCFPYQRHFFPIGRLDKDSEGLLFLTSDGELAQMLTHPSFEKEKEYIVSTRESLTEKVLESLSSGVRIGKDVTQECDVKKLGTHKFKIVLKEGKNRQIRRMCEAHGLDVVKLVRVRCGPVKLDISIGQTRKLTATEVNQLKNQS